MTNCYRICKVHYSEEEPSVWEKNRKNTFTNNTRIEDRMFTSDIKNNIHIFFL